ncbi:MAG: ABC transporter substrate-binding protein [Bacteroidota bacterium]
MTSIKVGGVAEHFNLPWHLLKESGKLEKEAFDFHWTDCHGGTGEMVRMLEQSSLDMAVLLTEGMLLNILKGGRARILGVFVSSSLEWGIHIPKEKENLLQSGQRLTYAISRKGSGSHLMALVHAEEKGIDPALINFREVGSLKGALDAFDQNLVDVFFWERFTTAPYCMPHKIKRVDSIFTPWPCFVVAVAPEFYLDHKEETNRLFHLVLQMASSFKNDPFGSEIIADRYGLSPSLSSTWFGAVQWGKGENLSLTQIRQVLQSLQESDIAAKSGDLPVPEFLVGE